jgi:hypothetical protein
VSVLTTSVAVCWLLGAVSITMNSSSSRKWCVVGAEIDTREGDQNPSIDLGNRSPSHILAHTFLRLWLQREFSPATCGLSETKSGDFQKPKAGISLQKVRNFHKNESVAQRFGDFAGGLDGLVISLGYDLEVEHGTPRVHIGAK